MTERFTYSVGATVYRRKTLTSIQKILIYTIVFAGIIGSGVLTWFSPSAPTGSTLFILALLSPTLITFISVITIALNPRGPEANFILPGPDIEPADCSTMQGKVLLPSGEVRDVEVIVPNVHGVSTLSTLITSITVPESDPLAIEEMSDLALETINLKYPSSQWQEPPTLK